MRNEWASNPALLSGGAQQHAPNPQQWLTGVNQPAPEPQPMPEPSHRVGPPGVSSGVSLRHLPDTTFKAVAAICQHYEEKCSGKYASDSAAARYVFDLSREVQSQLAALEAQAQDREARVASLSSTLSDWDASFGAASPLARDADALRLPLPAGGASPANVARALRAQALRIHELEAQLGGARAAADAVTADARAALAAQAAAGAVSGEEARREGAVAARAQLEEHAKALANMREQHDLALQQVIQEKDAEYHKATENHKKALNDVQLELLNNRQHMINTEAQWRRRLEDVEQRERAELARTKEHFEALLARAKGETAAALEGLGSAVAAGAAAGALDGGYPSGSGLSREAGEGGGLQGGGGGGAGDVDKLRSLAMLLEESRKEARWLRDRNGESERVIEALRKTIMRQAELNSQRDSSTGGGGGGGGGGSGGINTNNGPLRGHHYAGPRGPPSRGPRPGPPDWQSERAPPHHHHRGDGSGGGGAPHRDAHYNSRSGGGGRGGGGGGPPHLRAPPPHHHGNYQDDGGGDPDRSWGARSAPLPLHDAPDRSRSAPLPEHQAAAAALQQYLAAVPAAAAQQPWDRAPLRDSAAFLTMPYPPGAAPPAFGPGALFKHVGGGGGGGGARGGDGGGYGGGAHAMHHALPTRSSSSPHLQAHAQLGGGGGGAMAAQGGGAMRMPQPRQPASMLSRPGSMSSLNHIHEDVHEYEPGAGELDTATSVLSGF